MQRLFHFFWCTLHSCEEMHTCGCDLEGLLLRVVLLSCAGGGKRTAEGMAQAPDYQDNFTQVLKQTRETGCPQLCPSLSKARSNIRHEDLISRVSLAR